MIHKTEFTTYSLPEEGKQAEQQFLSVLHNEHETYLEMYGDTLKELYEELKVAYHKGVPLHILLDHTQSCGPTEKKMLEDLLQDCPDIDITITSAGPDAEKPSQIAHRKRIFDTGTYTICFGSVNASHDGFYSQTNDMVSFQSSEYCTGSVVKFLQRKKWARDTHPEWQLK